MGKITKKWHIFLREDNNNSFQIYCDMDGVLVDLEAGIEKRLDKKLKELSDDENTKPDVLQKAIEVHEKAIQVLHSGMFWQTLKQDPGFSDGVDAIINVLNEGTDLERKNFWATLPPEPDAMELWRWLNQVLKHSPIILSAPWPRKIIGEEEPVIDQACVDGKKEWLKVLVPQPKDVILTLKKEEHAAGNHILIDDMLEKYVEPWRGAGGIAVHHTSTENTKEELKEKLKKWLD